MDDCQKISWKFPRLVVLLFRLMNCIRTCWKCFAKDNFTGSLAGAAGSREHWRVASCLAAPAILSQAGRRICWRSSALPPDSWNLSRLFTNAHLEPSLSIIVFLFALLRPDQPIIVQGKAEAMLEQINKTGNDWPGLGCSMKTSLKTQAKLFDIFTQETQHLYIDAIVLEAHYYWLWRKIFYFKI